MGWVRGSIAILTSLYSQIYNPSHRQIYEWRKRRNKDRKTESTTISVSVNPERKRRKAVLTQWKV